MTWLCSGRATDQTTYRPTQLDKMCDVHESSLLPALPPLVKTFRLSNWIFSNLRAFVMYVT